VNITMTSMRTPLEYNGGVETHVMEISRRLVRKGVNVKVLSTSTECRYPYWRKLDGIMFEVYPAIAPFETYYFSIPLYKALKSDNSDIIHAHGYQTFALLAALASKKHTQKLFVTLHGAWPETLPTQVFNMGYRLLMGRLLQKADKIIGVAKVDLDRLGFNQIDVANIGKTYIMPNGVDIQEFALPVKKPSMIPNDSKFILSVARLEKYKGHQYAIECFAKLKSLNVQIGDLKLVIVGSGTYMSQLKSIAARLHVDRDVLFLSNLSKKELIGLYQNCEFFVLLSRYESHSVSVAEAIATGKPVLLTLTSGLAEIVQRGDAIGVPYPPEEETVTTLMQKILDDPNHFKPKNPLVYSWDDVVDRLLSLYEKSMD
jgi:1,4-alpha-glucan branching enzyme